MSNFLKSFSLSKSFNPLPFSFFVGLLLGVLLIADFELCDFLKAELDSVEFIRFGLLQRALTLCLSIKNVFSTYF